MFQDEAGFGRISKPRLCWVAGKERPRVPCLTFGNIDIRMAQWIHMMARIFLLLPVDVRVC